MLTIWPSIWHSRDSPYRLETVRRIWYGFHLIFHMQIKECTKLAQKKEVEDNLSGMKDVSSYFSLFE